MRPTLLPLPLVLLSALAACASGVPAAERKPSGPAAISGAHMTPVVRKPAPPPKPVFNVRDFGAKGDGTTNDAAAIQKAVDACAGSGGSVLLDQGVFRSAHLALKGGMTLYVAEGATLKATDDPRDFPVVLPKKVAGTVAWHHCRRSFLFADGVENLVLDGGGTIDGNGLGLHNGVTVDGKKITMNRYGTEPTKPGILRIFASRNIAVRNLALHNPHMWTQVYDGCENLTIEKIVERVLPHGQNSYNTDGMDICNCRHVVIRDNDIESDDDSICLKSHGPAGMEDVLIANNTVRNMGANAIKIGTSTAGDIRNVRILDNHVLRANLGGLCIESVDGSNISGIEVKGLTMEDCMHPFFIRLSYRGGYDEIAPAAYPRKIGSISGVSIENVVVAPTARGTTGPTWGNGWKEPSCTVTGITTRNLGNILFKDMRIVMPGGINAPVADPKENDRDYPQSSIFGRIPASAFFVRHADQVVFENVEVGTAKPDARPWLRAVGAKVEEKGVRDLGVVAPGK